MISGCNWSMKSGCIFHSTEPPASSVWISSCSCLKWWNQSLLAEKFAFLSLCNYSLPFHVPSLGWEDPLEKEMATHSSTLAWIIPWTEEHCRLQSMGSHRVGQDWTTSLTFFHFLCKKQFCCRTCNIEQHLMSYQQTLKIKELWLNFLSCLRFLCSVDCNGCLHFR